MTEATDVFDGPLLASVYDDLDPWAASDDFYLGMARKIGGAVLDLGCGTGKLACRIAAEGCDVVGADPAEGMLGVARSRPGTEAVAWVQGDGQSPLLAGLRAPPTRAADGVSKTCLGDGVGMLCPLPDA